MISEERLAELRRILRDDYGQDLAPEEVAEIGRRLVGLFTLLAEFDRWDQTVAAGACKAKKDKAVSVGPRSFSGP